MLTYQPWVRHAKTHKNQFSVRFWTSVEKLYEYLDIVVVLNLVERVESLQKSQYSISYYWRVAFL